MLEFAPLPTPAPRRTLKRTLKEKEATKKRLEEELAEDLAATAGRLRHIPPPPWGSSRNPNATYLFNFVNSHFLNRTAHEEAVAILEGWQPTPWKGMTWYGLTRNNPRCTNWNGNDQGYDPTAYLPDRVWIAPSMNLQWDGQEWLPFPHVHDASGATNTYSSYSASSRVSEKATAALCKAIEFGNSGGITKEDANAAYIEYAADPVGQRDSWFVTLSAFVRTRERVSQIRRKFNNQAEIYMTLEDIFCEFALDLKHRIESGQYTHAGKIQKWIGTIWGRFFFPEVQTKIFGYLDRTLYVNHADQAGDDDEDDRDVEIQNHSAAIKDVEKEQVGREREGYALLVSRDHIFRQLSKPVQDIVQLLCDGMTQDEIAVNLRISPRHLRRILPTIQACADESTVLPWPDGGDTIWGCDDSEPFSISACADESSDRFLTADEAATYLGGLNSRTVTRWAREGYIPSIPVGEGKRRLWRFVRTDLESWMLSRRQGGQNAA